ncbi:AAA family ATPase [Methylopila sp. Yamaguchi]|uniref:AAA family ATPase n=1 Tax=Methylopila sp. Yamaguchi TaxID=1437817 RepID=UPI000CCB3E07|nr:AAA family ATPase [Methylopila sp. Yamaguchi]GBD50593.1 ATPase [Methylopila sp. Yamaguchi]
MLRGLRIEWSKVEDRGVYPYDIPALAQIEELDLSASITILVGSNGSGKSTLLEAIATQLRCNPEGGSSHYNFVTEDTLSPLHRTLRLIRGAPTHKDAFFYRADTYYNLATEMRRIGARMEFYGGDDFHDMSHGQSVIQLLRHRFSPRGIYVMDEPEAALAPETQFEAIAAIAELARRGAQFVLATHSPLLMALPGAALYELTERGLERRAYHELGHVRLYKRFLADPASVVARLLED